LKSKPPTLAEKIRAALGTDFVTVDDIAKTVFGRTGERERSSVYVAIHRMGDEVEKRAAGYRRKS
jgi:hypothetical protein